MALTGLIYNTSKENDREQWRCSLAGAGLSLVNGSFEEGATVNSETDVVWHISGGQCYAWHGEFPKDISAGTTPVGVADWEPQTDLKDQWLYKNKLQRTDPFGDIKWDGEAAVAAALANLGLGDVAKMTDVRGLIDAVFPIGIPIPYPLGVVPITSHGVAWSKVNGSSFNTTTYPKAALMYPSGILPDMRGNVIRAWDDGRGIDPGRALLTEQMGSYLIHEWTANNVLGFYSANGVGLEEDPIIGAVPTLSAKGATAATTFAPAKLHLGMARMRNISFNYIVRLS